MKIRIPVVLSLVGLAALAGCGSDNSSGLKTYTQVDRLARPAVNELFASVAGNRHQINDTDNPTDDPNQLKNDITNFMTNTAGRSAAISNFVAAVLVPDVLKADLSKGGSAAYLGVETGGFTGGAFGGRKLTDDVIDTSLAVVFGTVLTDPAPNGIGGVTNLTADNHQIPALTTDNVGFGAKHFTDGVQNAAAWPYLGAPQ